MFDSEGDMPVIGVVPEDCAITAFDFDFEKWRDESRDKLKMQDYVVNNPGPCGEISLSTPESCTLGELMYYKIDRYHEYKNISDLAIGDLIAITNEESCLKGLYVVYEGIDGNIEITILTENKSEYAMYGWVDPEYNTIMDAACCTEPEPELTLVEKADAACKDAGLDNYYLCEDIGFITLPNGVSIYYSTNFEHLSGYVSVNAGDIGIIIGKNGFRSTYICSEGEWIRTKLNTPSKPRYNCVDW